MSRPSHQPDPRRPVRRGAVRGLAVLLGALSIGLAIGLAGSSANLPTNLHENEVRLSGFLLTGFGTSSSGPPATQQSVAGGTFRISGSVAGLYPGAHELLVLKVTNPQFFKIVVTSITTAITSAGAQCAAANLSVGAFAGQLSVPARGSAKTSVGVSLAQSAPNACMGATFSLTYHGIAQRAPA